jgi:hypothetical protein
MVLECKYLKQFSMQNGFSTIWGARKYFGGRASNFGGARVIWGCTRNVGVLDSWGCASIMGGVRVNWGRVSKAVVFSFAYAPCIRITLMHNNFTRKGECRRNLCPKRLVLGNSI